MKHETNFFRDRRHKLTGSQAAQDLIRFYRDLGYTDEQIKAEMKRIKEEREKAKAGQE